MRRPASRIACWLSMALLAVSVVHAQDTTEARLREALRQTAEKLHTTEAALEQQQLATTAAERERDALKQAPPRAAKADVAQAAVLRGRLAATAGELAQASADAQKWQAAQQAAAQTAQTKETERAALAEQLAQLRARTERCVANDDAFFASGHEIAALYRDRAFVSYFTYHRLPLGFDRVREENRVRALEDRFADQLAQAHHCRTDATSAPSALPTSTPPLTPPTSASPLTPPAQAGEAGQ